MNQSTCAHCGDHVGEKSPTGPAATYCSKKCRDAASYARRKNSINAALRAARLAQRRVIVKTCPTCGTDFSPEHSSKQIYCSKPCLSKAMRDSTTRRCVVDGCSRFVRAQDRCVTHYNATRREAEPEDRAVRNGDPIRRAAALREKTRFRNSVMRAPDADDIDAVALGERDGWVCGICGELIDKTIAYPDRMAATIDHVMPISHGGRHRWDNAQISHFACNMAKSDRAA